jgi:hypothetical protein
MQPLQGCESLCKILYYNNVSSTTINTQPCRGYTFVVILIRPLYITEGVLKVINSLTAKIAKLPAEHAKL